MLIILSFSSGYVFQHRYIHDNDGLLPVVLTNDNQEITNYVSWVIASSTFGAVCRLQLVSYLSQSIRLFWLRARFLCLVKAWSVRSTRLALRWGNSDPCRCWRGN